ncbi:acetoacetate decarboxylase [Actinomadura craniellae]|uniref:Acetoacetate decarboxylase n=1 Tax=Actinomadura craniellae TaxID=2231787 RepID=A0A365HDJ7_9ACTN|nr:acetoacetate decarboxylase family protein [Actinomadura craniellae]RAY17102.1 acetoacetate decarboxylase [Actinomadura craniellae]
MYVIQNQKIAMPVEIRHARVASAMFPVPARTAQEVVGYSGLAVTATLGRSLCSLAFIEYFDGDLGPYHEFAVAFLVDQPDTRSPGAFIHWLPVDGSFTLDAGRTIWGFPKVLTHLPIDWSAPHRAAVHEGGRPAVAMQVRPGLPVPDGAGAPKIDAYSHLDGVTRRTPWTMSPSGVRMRPGGAVVRLGDHPVAEDLRRLGLDRTPALSSTTVTHLTMSFGEATAL